MKDVDPFARLQIEAIGMDNEEAIATDDGAYIA